MDVAVIFVRYSQTILVLMMTMDIQYRIFSLFC